MPIGRERTELDKKPTWFIFVAANFLVVLGTAITWILFARVNNPGVYFVPTLVCNLLGMVLCGLFIWLELREIAPKMMHFQRKWLWYYVASAIVFIIAIVFNAVFFFGYLRSHVTPIVPIDIKYSWPLVVFFVITAVLSLVSIGLQRYARFKIDLDIYKRKRGQMPKQKEEKPSESKPKDSTPKASGGLMDQIDNK